MLPDYVAKIGSFLLGFIGSGMLLNYAETGNIFSVCNGQVIRFLLVCSLCGLFALGLWAFV